MNNIKNIVEKDFSTIYTHFKEFQYNQEYKSYWDICIKAICDKELLSHIIFCNDYLEVPPVKTFLIYFREELILITGNKNAELPIFAKRGIGAFWGMVFKKVLGYNLQKIVSVSMNDYFIVKTATLFMKG